MQPCREICTETIKNRSGRKRAEKLRPAAAWMGAPGADEPLRLRAAEEARRKPTSLQWFIPLFSLALVGVNGSCQAWTSADLLCLCLGNGASPRGPEFGIRIRHLNGPPFAACHWKIGGARACRVPPAERTLASLLCSMTPLRLTVYFLSPPFLVPSATPFFLFALEKSKLRQLSMPENANQFFYKERDIVSPYQQTGSFNLRILSNKHSFMCIWTWKN